jgi:hypothetical protein
VNLCHRAGQHILVNKEEICVPIWAIA